MSACVALRKPGDDTCDKNFIVRTLDTTTILVNASVNLAAGASTSDLTHVTVRLNGDVFLAAGFALPGGPCPGGFVPDPDNKGFTCHTGPFSKSATVGMNVVVVAPRSTRDGSIFSLDATLFEDNNPVTVTDPSEDVTVSAGPRYELVKTFQSSTSVGFDGPTGSTGKGLVQGWVIGIRSQQDDVRGLSALREPIIVDDLVVATPTTPVWLHACDTTSTGGWPDQVSVVAAPASQIRPPTISQCIPASSAVVAIQLDGLDWDRITVPPTIPLGIPTGLIAYFGLQTWVGLADIAAAGSVTVCNSVETSGPGDSTSRTWHPGTATPTWHPLDIAGRPNLIGGTEPIANNGECVDLALQTTAQFAKVPEIPANGGGVPDTSTTQSRIHFGNTGTSDYPDGAALCDKWDNSRFDLAGLSSNSSFDPLVDVEYGTGNWGANGPPTDGQRWYQQATQTCANSNFTPGPSASGIRLSTINGFLPPTPFAYNMVRITVREKIPISGYVDLVLRWRMMPGHVPGEEFRNYSAAFYPHFPVGAEWSTSDCPLDSSTPLACRSGLARGESAGFGSHWWTIIAGSVQVKKSRVDTVAYEPGDTVPWRIQARGVAPTGATSGLTRDVVITDTLPPGFTYVSPTKWTLPVGGLSPPTCTPAPQNAVTVQTCTWTIGALQWTSGYSVDFTFDTTVWPFAPSQVYRNVVHASTPDDPRPSAAGIDIRVSQADVLVVLAVGAAIQKSVSPAAPQPGNQLVYTLRYGNPSGTAVASMDAIDILPFNGDPRGSIFGVGSFALTGLTPSTKVPSPVEVTWASKDDPAVLDQVDGSDGYLDPFSAQPLGSSQWPCRIADIGNPVACPQITSLDQVTAIRLVGTGTAAQPFLPGSTGPFSVTLTYQVGECTPGDKFANSWMAQFEGLLPVRFLADTAAVDGCATGPSEPGISIAKEVQNAEGQWVETALLPSGAQVTWRITVTNVGNTLLHDLIVTDPAFNGCETAAAAAAPTEPPAGPVVQLHLHRSPAHSGIHQHCVCHRNWAERQKGRRRRRREDGDGAADVGGLPTDGRRSTRPVRFRHRRTGATGCHCPGLGPACGCPEW